MKLTAQHLTKTIGEKKVLSQVEFSWQTGEIVGLVGRNGAGKTTLMRTLVDQYHADHGQVAIDDQDLTAVPEARQQLIYIDPTEGFFARLTLAKLGRLYALGYPTFDQARYRSLLADNDLVLAQRYGELSKGYQALVVMALNLASAVPLILLDEPFDGLDLFIREMIVKAVIDEVAAGQRGFLIASHDLAELDGLADRVLFLKRGTISKTVTLEAVRDEAAKLQLVFPATQIPAAVRQYGQILNVQGRVITALFSPYTAAVEAALTAEQPVLIEKLPLSLSDLFRSEYAEEVHRD